MTISTEKKLEVLEWLATKLVIRDIDTFENDATLKFPSFFVPFNHVADLDDPYQALVNAMISDRQFPMTLEKQEEFARLADKILSEIFEDEKNKLLKKKKNKK